VTETITNVQVDLAPPTVTGVAFATPNDSLAVGETAVLTVAFSENIVVTGTGATLTLSNGATATYVGLSGTNGMQFSYTVGAGNTATSDLSVNSLNLAAGTTIRDAAGNTANVAGAAINPTGTVAVDVSAPTVTGVTFATPNTSLTNSGVANLTVAFSENIVVGTASGSPTLTLSNGATATYVGTSGASGMQFRYTVGPNDAASSDLAVTSLNLNGATIRDAAGNTANVSGAATNPTGTVVVICFYPGTLVATPSGPRAVETLAIGDEVLTHEGPARPSAGWAGRPSPPASPTRCTSCRSASAPAPWAAGCPSGTSSSPPAMPC
jgi:hypothetical protein